MNEIEKIINISKIFFDKLLIKIDKLEVINEKENIYYIKLKTEESSLVIGFSGKNLDDIRNILKILISNELGIQIILHIEVNDYLYKKDEKLFEYVLKKINFLRNTGKEVILPFFNSYERKKIHSYINDNNFDDIETQSLGEGRERRIHIFKKEKKLTIDMDGVDI